MFNDRIPKLREKNPNPVENLFFKWKVDSESRKFMVFTGYADVGLLKIEFH